MEAKEQTDKKTILIVDDEKNIVNLLVHNLTREGYDTLEAYDGISAVEIAVEKKPDLILLDRMLPKQDGISVCVQIRQTHHMNTPIIMLTAKSEETDKIVGLELGADDYMTKPFSIRELVARVKANLRKSEFNVYNNTTNNIINNSSVNNNISNNSSEEETEQIKIYIGEDKIIIGDLELDLERFIVKIRGKEVELTIKEFEVLKYLANQPGQVVTRELLLEKVWGYEYYGDIRTVDVTVNRIRGKIELDTTNPKILMTKRGIGYYIADKQ